ncbi:MAG: hypothetical protein E6H52_08605 [Betaproteobacteria bacterium]|nr:MAG: hypothetical protein E6H52_08605 [Betaproteobacteria bacterium]
MSLKFNSQLVAPKSPDAARTVTWCSLAFLNALRKARIDAASGNVSSVAPKLRLLPRQAFAQPIAPPAFRCSGLASMGKSSKSSETSAETR